MNSINYAKLSGINTPVGQRLPLAGRDQDMIPNAAGGFVFRISHWDQMIRFIVLGTEGGTYYIGEKPLTENAAQAVLKCIKEDPRRVLKEVVEISTQGRAPKQNPGLFVLALLSAYTVDEKVKHEVRDAVVKVCRTPSVLFTFLKYAQELRGVGPSLRKAIAKYYTETELDKLDMHLIKYRERDGFSHRDVLRISHPKTTDKARNDLFAYAVGKQPAPKGSMAAMHEELKGLKPDSKIDVERIVASILVSKMPREGIPNEFLNNKGVWFALLQSMPMHAMLRNLGKMSSIGLFDKGMKAEVSLVVERLNNETYIQKSRVHPFDVLKAIKIYRTGHGVKGTLTWTANEEILRALDNALVLAYKNAPSTGKRFMLGADVSGSMGCPVLGMDYMSAYEASSAYIALLNATEKDVHYVAFGSGTNTSGKVWSTKWTWKVPVTARRENGLSVMDIKKTDKMSDILSKIKSYNMGAGTDCALPMRYALENKIPVDVFIITTDNESYDGDVHVTTALNNYRRTMGINAKLVVLATAATSYSVADASDAGMLDICGFDSSIPQVIAEFIK